jgi:hypothetical protein
MMIGRKRESKTDGAAAAAAGNWRVEAALLATWSLVREANCLRWDLKLSLRNRIYYID